MLSENAFLKRVSEKSFVEPGFEKELTLPNVKTVLKLIKSIESGTNQSTAEAQDIKLALIGKTTSVHDPDPLVYHFKCDYKDQSFFLKHSLHTSLLGSGGYKEALGNAKAQKILEDHSITWAEVIKFKLGHTAKKEQFFISEWKDACTFKTLKEYLSELENHNRDAEEEQRYADAIAKLTTLKKLFTGFFDFHPHNIWIDKTTGKFYLFDLSIWGSI